MYTANPAKSGHSKTYIQLSELPSRARTTSMEKAVPHRASPRTRVRCSLTAERPVRRVGGSAGCARALGSDRSTLPPYRSGPGPPGPGRVTGPCPAHPMLLGSRVQLGVCERTCRFTAQH